MRTLSRLFVLGLCSVIGSTAAVSAAAPGEGVAVVSRARVIVDNDFGGDPDGLFQLAHQLLSPSAEVRAIIGSRHYDGGFYGSPGSSARSVEVATELLGVMKLTNPPPILAGAESRLPDLHTPARSPGAEFIVREAMRRDTQQPLYVVCGAGLTTVASAYLSEPRIAERIRLVWIGGAEYAGLAVPPPGAGDPEYNLGIDIVAAQVVFNDSAIPLWQVPRDAYRQPLVSQAELQVRVKRAGPLGAWLVGRLEEVTRQAQGRLGETYVLGDSPLVLLTALQSPWDPDACSSRHVIVPAPRISGSGRYESNPAGRPIRVYTQVDARLMFEDLYAKLAR